MAVLAYIFLTVTSGSEREVCGRLSEYEEVIELNEVYGEYDIILGVSAEDLNRLDEFITDKVRSIPEVILTYTMIVARKCK
ncbi:MAG: AsnC family transcriptional regulator [Candidatus Bathyarchaeota archaeon B26-2]|nr:MAG: AsnC family transcriptional regulator [Candidatus Bathyarchaeota archaeon B26-2]